VKLNLSNARTEQTLGPIMMLNSSKDAESHTNVPCGVPTIINIKPTSGLENLPESASMGYNNLRGTCKPWNNGDNETKFTHLIFIHQEMWPGSQLLLSFWNCPLYFLLVKNYFYTLSYFLNILSYKKINRPKQQ